MKRILEIAAYKSGDLRLEVLDLTKIKNTVRENTALFVGQTTVTTRVNGEHFSASYRISRAYEKQQGQWRMVTSQRTRVPEPVARVMSPDGASAVPVPATGNGLPVSNAGTHRQSEWWN